MGAEPASDMWDDDARDTAELLAQADIEPGSEKWPQTLSEGFDVVAAEFLRRGLDHDTALTLAQAAIIALGEHLGGRPIYWPRGDRLQNAVRDRAIWQDFTGNNTWELARRHGLTERTVQRILATQRALNTRRIQPELFRE